MQLAHRIVATDPRGFGRGPQRDLSCDPPPATIRADVRLFVTTFLAGFIFVSILIA